VKRSSPAQGFTLAELLVVLALITLLSGLVFIGARAVLERSRQAACASNLRQIGAALQSYIQDNDGNLPPMQAMRLSKMDEVPVMDTVLLPYASGPGIFRCPADPGQWEQSGCSYWWYETVTLKPSGHNYKNTTLESFFLGTGDPSKIPLILDKEGFHPAPRPLNALYADGHAGPLEASNPNAK
jgi:prepilin-type N-terminal cleavage/methylation domain-containing protein/prepilin-type processing-associated H-X9-DG protein